MDGYRTVEVTEYAADGSSATSEVLAWLDPQASARDELDALGASATGAMPYHDATTGFGPFLLARFPRRFGHWPLAVAWLRETEPPWRAGWGLSWRHGTRTTVLALARRTDAPVMELDE